MNYNTARLNMVNGQLRPNKVNNTAILAQFAEIPRELFAHPSAKDVAYADMPLDIGKGRKMLSPLVTARLLQELNPQPSDIALVLAAGTGYSAAVLSKFVQHVYAIEEDKQLCQNANNTLVDTACGNVTVVEKTPAKGHPSQSPYQIIWIDGLIEYIPIQIIEQLAPNGKIAAVVKGQDDLAEATVYQKKKNTLFAQPQFETKELPLIEGFGQGEKFEF
ncbi:MAG: protein-L-isoaspartate O-methyltransferase [Alphaproteobacteria bacterium]|nr:protein-L-isoaspartate O-methyltransferase [Alphaproteobacteria bacterium]